LSEAPRVFISYARSDRDYAVALREELCAVGLTVWHDLKDLEAGQWWSQIAAALECESLEHIVLIVSPSAIASRVVARECWLAQREGKTASLVVSPAHKGKIAFQELPRWLREEHHYDLSEPDQQRAFVERLKRPGLGARRPRPEGRPMPEGYVVRKREYMALQNALLDSCNEATSNVVVLRGPGGFGKTTLATALINDEKIQQAYFNGILFIALGEGLTKHPPTLTGRQLLEETIKEKIESLIETLANKRERFPDLDSAKSRLKETLDRRNGAVLIWIEDAWADEHVRHFIDASPSASKLVTTRVMDLLPEARHVHVEELDDAEGEPLDCISFGLPGTGAANIHELHALANVTAGRWPLLIRQINAQLRYQTTPRPGRPGQTLSDAIVSVRARLTHAGLDDLDKATEINRAKAVRLSVNLSLEMLRREDSHRGYPEGFHEARYAELACFLEPEIPIAAIARLWTPDLMGMPLDPPVLDKGVRGTQWNSHEETCAILERMSVLGLIQHIDVTVADGWIRLHDVIRQYIHNTVNNKITEINTRLVGLYGEDPTATTSQ
jgi:hypothetical protein